MEAQKVRVLLVDDDPDFLEICAERLMAAEERIQVDTVASGEQCLDRLGEDRFDVVLADYWMQPGMTGLQLLTSLRDRGVEVPFIFLTARGSEGVAAEALRLGADDYLVKGVDPSGYARLAEAVIQAAERFTPPTTRPGPTGRLRLPPRTPAATQRRYELLRAVVEEIPVGILVLDAEGSTVAGNPRLYDLLGVEARDLGEWIDELWANAEERLGGASVVFREMLDHGAPIEHLEFALTSADGRLLRLQARGRRIPSAGGDGAAPAGFVIAFEDVAEERRAEHALRRSASSAREVAEQRSLTLERVMKAMSHDMKSPLVSIAGFASLLRDPTREFSAEERNRQLERIISNSERLHGMIEDLLKLRAPRPPSEIESE